MKPVSQLEGDKKMATAQIDLHDSDLKITSRHFHSTDPGVIVTCNDGDDVVHVPLSLALEIVRLNEAYKKEMIEEDTTEAKDCGLDDIVWP